MTPAQRTRAWVWSHRGELALFVIFAVLYTLTAYPGPGGRINYGDSVKFQHLPLHDGLPHSTGYPTYLALGELFILLPLHPVAYRMTALSILSGAVTVALVANLGRRLASHPLGLGAGVLYGVSATAWMVNTEAEVYALHSLFVVGALSALVWWASDGPRGALIAGWGIYLLGFGNHLTSIALLPAVLALTLLPDRRRTVLDARTLVPIAALGLLGALQYVLIVWRANTPGTVMEFMSPEPTALELLRFVTGGQFGDRFFATDPLWGQIELTMQTAAELGGVGVLLAGLGWFALTRPSLRIGFGLAVAGPAAFGLFYDIEGGLYWLPAWLALAVLAGASAYSATRGAVLVIGVLAAAANSLLMHDIQPTNARLDTLTDWAATAEGCDAVLAGPNNYPARQLRRYLAHTSDVDWIVNPDFLPPERFCFAPRYLANISESGRYTITPRVSVGLDEFLRDSARYTVIIAVKDEARLALDPAAIATVARWGGDLGSLTRRGAYAAVFTQGSLVDEALSDTAATVTVGDITVASAGFDTGNRASIEVDGEEHALNRRGLNIVVLDRHGALLHSVVFDTHTSSTSTSLYEATITR
jgi:hypothetical protein